MRDAATWKQLLPPPAFLSAAEQTPWRYDLFMLLRWIDAKQKKAPRLGTATRPGDECVRLGQKVSLQFAPANIDAISTNQDGRVVIRQRGFGLFGPNGPLPIHLTEYVLDRTDNYRDRSLSAFTDIFHHRLLLLFYRAWAQGQPTVSMDRRDDNRFAGYVSSLIGLGETSLRNRDAVPDGAKLFNAGHFSRQTRNPEGIVSALKSFFGCRFVLEERRFHWLRLHRDDCTPLGDANAQARLGLGAICGVTVPDRHGRFRLRAGPLDLDSYQRFLPIGTRYRQVRDWIRNYVGFEFAWDVCLVLSATEVPLTSLGGATRLGWTSWLGTRATARDADDLILDVEAGCKN
jgi:type VI secretion system protein ImpH